MNDEEKKEQSAQEQSAEKQSTEKQSAEKQSAQAQGASEKPAQDTAKEQSAQSGEADVKQTTESAPAAETDKDGGKAKEEPSEPKKTEEAAQAKAEKKQSVAADADGEKKADEEKKAPAPKKPAGEAKPAGKAAGAKGKKAEPKPPDPRAVAAKETAEQMKKLLVSEFDEEAVEETGAAQFKPMLVINKKYWLKAVDFLRTHEDWLLNYVECMAGTDYPDYLETVIFVQSTELGHFICLKTRTDKETAEVPSLVSAHPGVNWEEREIYDLVGVNFTGHPDMRRIMMWDEFEGHPLRKDYNEWG